MGIDLECEYASGALRVVLWGDVHHETNREAEQKWLQKMQSFDGKILAELAPALLNNSRLNDDLDRVGLVYRLPIAVSREALGEVFDDRGLPAKNPVASWKQRSELQYMDLSTEAMWRDMREVVAFVLDSPRCCYLPFIPYIEDAKVYLKEWWNKFQGHVGSRWDETLTAGLYAVEKLRYKPTRDVGFFQLSFDVGHLLRLGTCLLKNKSVCSFTGWAHTQFMASVLEELGWKCESTEKRGELLAPQPEGSSFSLKDLQLAVWWIRFRSMAMVKDEDGDEADEFTVIKFVDSYCLHSRCWNFAHGEPCLGCGHPFCGAHVDHLCDLGKAVARRPREQHRL